MSKQVFFTIYVTSSYVTDLLILTNIRVSNNKLDTKIDSFYKELSGQRPDLFPDDIWFI